MIKENKVIVCDIDGTLTIQSNETVDYSMVKVSVAMRDRLQELSLQGYWIILYTSRSMRSQQGNIGTIIKNTAPVLFEWLSKNNIPYDELHFGKPWCGHNGFYVDDRAVRPREFLTNTIDELSRLVEKDRLNK